MASKPQLEKFVTPKGVLSYPKLRTPDTKFKALGEYGTKVVFDRTDVEGLIKKVDAAHAKAYKDALAALIEAGKVKMIDGEPAVLKDGKPQKEKGKLKVYELGSLPYQEELDDDGNETGKVIFNFKAMAAYASKKEKDENGQAKVIQLTPPALVDAAGKALPKSVNPWGGTIAKISAEIKPFAAPLFAGASLRLLGVQVLELRAGGGARDAASLGFTAEEGYTAEEEESTSDFSDETATAAADASDTPDF